MFPIFANKACMFINHTPITFLWWVPFGTCIKQCLLLYIVLMFFKVTKLKLQILNQNKDQMKKQHYSKNFKIDIIKNNTDVNCHVWSLVIPKWYSTWTKQFCHDKTDKHLSRQTCSNISGRLSANNSTIKSNSINLFPIILTKDQAPFCMRFYIHGHIQYTPSVVHQRSYITIILWSSQKIFMLSIVRSFIQVCSENIWESTSDLYATSVPPWQIYSRIYERFKHLSIQLISRHHLGLHHCLALLMLMLP